MAYTLSGAVVRLQAIAGGLSGIKRAPDNPPESSSVFPFAISYASRIESTPITGGITRRLTTLVTEIHCARVLLPVAVEQAVAYGDSFPAAVWADITLDGNVNHVNSIAGEFVSFEYAGTTTIGWRFEILTKMED